jgi:hypothetical protein
MALGFVDGKPWPRSMIAKMLGWSVSKVVRVEWKVYSALRRSGLPERLHDYLVDDGERAALRALRQQARMRDVQQRGLRQAVFCDRHGWSTPATGMGICAGCPCALPQQTSTAKKPGRPRHYCTSDCRQAAYRRRSAARPSS